MLDEGKTIEGRDRALLAGRVTTARAQEQFRMSEGMLSNETSASKIRTVGSMSGRGIVVKSKTLAPAQWRKPGETATLATLDNRTSSRAYMAPWG